MRPGRDGSELGQRTHQGELSDAVLAYVIDATHGSMIEWDALVMTYGMIISS